MRTRNTDKKTNDNTAAPRKFSQLTLPQRKIVGSCLLILEVGLRLSTSISSNVGH